MATSTLADELTQDMVEVHLLARSPGDLNRPVGESGVTIFDAYVEQVMAEVIAVVGHNVRGDKRALALKCAAYGVAAEIEYAIAPEQQLQGGIGRGWYLSQRYLQLKEELRGMPADGSGGAGRGISRVRSPKRDAYPDPMRRR